MTLVITGSGSYDNSSNVYRVLDDLHKEYKVDVVVYESFREGNELVGVGQYVHRWAIKNNAFHVGVPLLEYTRKAVANQKRAMLHFNPNLIVVFPGGEGIMEVALKAGGARILEVGE